MLSSSKRKIRQGARNGALKRAELARRSRRVAIRRVLEVRESSLTVKEISEGSQRSPAVVRATLKELPVIEGTERRGTYRLKDGDGRA